MKKMILAVVCSMALIMTSCEKDEGKLPSIKFDSSSNYTSSDVTLAEGDTAWIRVIADKTEDKDVLKKFDISMSENNGATQSVHNQDIGSSEEDHFEYTYPAIAGAGSGTVRKFTFTVTNRDGLVGQISLNLTTQ